MPGPVSVEIKDQGIVYNAERDEWYSAWQSVFRPSAKAAPINISTAASHVIIPGVARKRIKLVSLFLTVAGEVNITLYDGATVMSGAMDFGGVSEPRGIVIPVAFSPLELAEGNDFKILLNAAAQVSGAVCYFYQ